MSGAGGIIMNAKDAATWLQTLLLQGANPTTGEQIIPAEAVAHISTGVSDRVCCRLILQCIAPHSLQYSFAVWRQSGSGHLSRLSYVVVALSGDV